MEEPLQCTNPGSSFMVTMPGKLLQVAAKYNYVMSRPLLCLCVYGLSSLILHCIFFSADQPPLQGPWPVPNNLGFRLALVYCIRPCQCPAQILWLNLEFACNRVRHFPSSWQLPTQSIHISASLPLSPALRELAGPQAGAATTSAGWESLCECASLPCSKWNHSEVYLTWFLQDLNRDAATISHGGNLLIMHLLFTFLCLVFPILMLPRTTSQIKFLQPHPISRSAFLCDLPVAIFSDS